jgi:hypothetical protein
MQNKLNSIRGPERGLFAGLAGAVVCALILSTAGQEARAAGRGPFGVQVGGCCPDQDRDDHRDGGQACRPDVFPPGAKPYGKSFGEWTALWWQWAMSMPLTHNPLADTAEISAGQAGKVWFLGGSFVSGEAKRTGTVPSGKALFLALLNTECSTVEADPFHGDTAAQLRACAKGWVDGAAAICSIDGVPVKHLEAYRFQSPVFNFGPLPADNVLGVAAGATGKSVSDGLWLMLEPLPDGQHTIEFIGVFAAGFTLHITYNLTVAPENPGVFPPEAKPYGHTYEEWTAEWWKWAMSMPLTHNPLADTAEISAGQDGKVWFLGGSFVSGEANRTGTIPASKALCFPVLNTECSTVEADPFHGDTEAQLRACAKGWVDGATGVCSIDGVAVKNLEAYRFQSPMFHFGPLPADNVLGVATGAKGRSVSDGFWLLLEPLSEGQHTIEFIGTFAGGFSFHIRYNLTVEAEKCPPRR